MRSFVELLQWLCLIPVLGGSLFGLLCVPAALWFCRQRGAAAGTFPDGQWPPVTVLKPVYGVEKQLKANLRTMCLQDYPDYQVVFSAQRPDDPALPILRELQQEFGASRVAVVVKNLQAGMNGKVNNLIGGLTEAKHEILVISDSDIRVRPEYLKTVVGPLADPTVGCVCTPFKAVNADRWYEQLELLSMNADFMPSVMFALTTGASNYSNGQSITLRRDTLTKIGGLDSLAEYLVEDYEIGRRIWESGQRMAVPPHFIEATVDLKSVAQWWSHQVYWDQNTRFAQPGGFAATVLTRSVPFALLYALLRLMDPIGLAVLGGAVALRLATTALVLGRIGDRAGLRGLWLLPLRDVLGLASWALAFTQRTVIWRGAEFVLTRNGRLVPREARS
ncbi:MAG: bacteriohopanetetrol glucosamine biosynthesis glycosyltransferase HpnI [Nitrospiraceae bacterium]